MNLEYDEIEHLYKMRDAYQARMRALELQEAQLGTHCPSHIQVEREQVAAALTKTQRQIEGLPPKARRSTKPSHFSSFASAFAKVMVPTLVIGFLSIVAFATVPSRLSEYIPHTTGLPSQDSQGDEESSDIGESSMEESAYHGAASAGAKHDKCQTRNAGIIYMTPQQTKILVVCDNKVFFVVITYLDHGVYQVDADD